MCNSPIRLKNPNRGRFVATSNGLVSDTQSQYINAPCGNCSACKFVKQSSIFQRMLVESWHSYVYFVTLTYNNESLIKVDVGDDTYSVAPYDDIQKMMKRIRKKSPFDGRSFKQLFVREYGSRRGRAHWHGLFFIDRVDDNDSSLNYLAYQAELTSLLKSEWKRNIGKSDKFPQYRDNFTYAELYKGGKLFSNFDCHYVTTNVFGDEQNPLFYVLKYISKDSKLFARMKFKASEEFGYNTPEYTEFMELAKPKIWKSVGFGIPQDSSLIPSMIEKAVSLNEPFAKFYDRGCSYPLSRYYKAKYMSLDQAKFFAQRSVDEYGFAFVESPNQESSQRLEESSARSLENSSRVDVFDYFDEFENE